MNLPDFKIITTRLIPGILLLLPSFTVLAGTLNVAVASNFAQTLHILADDFNKRTGHEIRISSASTGKLYAQINNGAPFDVFLAADEGRPDKLIEAGKATIDFSYIYALGKLVFLSNIKSASNCEDILKDDSLKRLAIANPKTAPYGAAAKEVLEKLGYWNEIKPKLITGENIAQTLQFISTGSVTAGFIAKSMLNDLKEDSDSCTWDIPADMYHPIKQKMVVLKKSANKPAVLAFWDYMHSKESAEIIKDNGYNTL